MGFFSAILDLLFPPRCVFCQRVLSPGEDGVCARCEKSLARPEEQAVEDRGEAFTVCASPLLYAGAARDSFLRFKFREQTGYAKVYGRLMAACVAENLSGRYDLITWVPLSKGRLKSRGYDQARLLCEAAALELGAEAVPTLQKYRDVPAQSGVGDAAKRRANIRGVYRVPNPELVADRRVLLVDDILTTGSTLDECARTLLEAGAREVLCATLARTRDREETAADVL